eukprot:3350950-Prymnesium_polylepis.1
MAYLDAAAKQLRALQEAHGADRGGAASGAVAVSGGEVAVGGAVAAGGAAAGDGEWGEQQALSLRIERCLTLLRLFVEEVENKAGGAGRAQRHGTAVRGVPMRIQVTVVGGSNSPKLEVVTESSATIGTLRSRVWQELAQHGEWQPPAPRDLRLITAGKELKDELLVLAELKLREPYSIHVMRRA